MLAGGMLKSREMASTGGRARQIEQGFSVYVEDEC